MAFIRRKGNSYYLTHNTREGAKIRQVQLAKLGRSAAITPAIEADVRKRFPFLALDWEAMRAAAETITVEVDCPECGGTGRRREMQK